jgi:hypothetical protein
MQIVLFGASGMIGQRIAREALERGHQVTAAVRDITTFQPFDERLQTVQGDATDAVSVANAARGADAVVSSISPTGGQPPAIFIDSAHALIAGTKQAGVKRLVVVGGAGSLEVEPGVLLMDRMELPEEWMPMIRAHKQGLDVYCSGEAEGLDWTYISPAAEIAPGERTGQYRAGGDQLLTDANGQSRISAEDYAVALLDELEQPKNIARRMTVAY